MQAKFSETLRSYAHDYHFDIDGALFWAPYLRNDNYTQDPNVPRGLGKSLPGEIKAAAEYIKRLFPDADGEMMRRKLTDGSLPEAQHNYKAIECSGFAYYLLSSLYEQLLHKELMDDLSVPKSHVLNGAYKFDDWRAAYVLSDDEAAALPEDVPMAWVVEKFRRDPMRLCRVAGLLSDFSSVSVSPEDVLPGDLLDVCLKDSPIPHTAVVLEATDAYIEVAHSSRKDEKDLGGVAIERINRSDFVIGNDVLASPREFRGVRRLRSLYEAYAAS